MTAEEEIQETADSTGKEEEILVKEKVPQVFTLEILKVIKDAQQQHGLRHGDYQRYRGYCARKIRRLRKVVHLQQGDRRHYKRKDVTAANIIDNRSLLIPLMMAERAWSYGMQLRQESNTEPRKKFHLIARLRKAANYSLALEEVCNAANCDPRTRLEAQAYVSWIHGSLHFEIQLWRRAIDHLKKAQIVYEKLAEVVSEADVHIYKNRVEELNPTIRYCAYNVGDNVSDEDLLSLRTHGDFMANFDALLEKRQSDSAGTEIEWRGHSLNLRPERVRLYVLADQQLDAALTHAKDDQHKLQLLEDNLLDCKDAIASLRDVMASDPSLKVARAPGAPLLPLQMLLTFLMHSRLSRTMQRNLLMAEQLRAGSGEKKPRPQDLARFYEMVLQNLQELIALPGLENDVKYKKELEGKVSLYKAIRCFFIAEYLVTLKRWKEAVALYERASEYHSKSVKDSATKSDWARLVADIEKSKFSAVAHSELDDGATEESAATKQFRSKKPLSERLEEYKEEPTLLTKNPGLVKFPPEMRPIPCKPLFFDLALNFAEFPNLDDKMDSAGKRQNPSGITGLVKGFLGWGK